MDYSIFRWITVFCFLLTLQTLIHTDDAHGGKKKKNYNKNGLQTKHTQTSKQIEKPRWNWNFAFRFNIADRKVLLLSKFFIVYVNVCMGSFLFSYIRIKRCHIANEKQKRIKKNNEWKFIENQFRARITWTKERSLYSN